MNNKTQALLNLIKENPDLPIVPMVDYEVVEDGYGRWMGSFGHCYVGEYALFYDRYFDDREEFEDFYYDYYSEDLNEKFDYDPFTRRNGKALNDYLHTVSDKYFKKAIIVNIDLPEE